MDNQTSLASMNLLRVSEVANMLAVSPSYIYLLVQKKEIPFVRLGTGIRFRFGDLEAYIEANTTTSVDQNLDYNDS